MMTIVSVGGGQDSTAILYKIGNDPAFRAKYAPGKVIAVMADTGDEHDETVAHTDTLAAFCASHDIEWQYLTVNRGYHSGPWANGLGEFYRTKSAIGSQAFPKTCTDNLKIQPIYRYLAERLSIELAGDTRLADRKQSLYLYKARYGTLKVIVGIAKGEESRVAKADESGKKPRSKWFAECVERIYPLIDEGMDRAACQAYIASVGAAVPPPSNCFMCPFKSPIEILWTAKHDRARFDVWVALEARKLAANAHLNAVPNAKGKIVNQNYGVYKTKTLPDVLAAARIQFAHMTDADLNDYRMSHGHCVKSAY